MTYGNSDDSGPRVKALGIGKWYFSQTTRYTYWTSLPALFHTLAPHPLQKSPPTAILPKLRHPLARLNSSRRRTALLVS
jgi:hypothetical protein